MADYEEIKWTITPEEVLQSRGVRFKKKSQWLDVKHCPFCGGGQRKSPNTFAVHSQKGYYFCLRTSCGEKGNFWKLLIFYGYNPPDHIDRSSRSFKKKQKKKFIYGK